MAGIEKICEISDEYVGWEMYDIKRNSIQVLPEYRNLFKNKEYKLFIEYKRPEEKFDTSHWDFCLIVPEVQGKVKGRFFNYTYNIRATKKNLRKLLGVKQLKYKKVENLFNFINNLNPF